MRGYKGFPILALHSPFHPVGGMVTDYMHNVLIGVTKALLGFWFDDANKRVVFNIQTCMQVLILYIYHAVCIIFT